MKTVVRLSKLKGCNIPDYNTFLSVNEDGSVVLKLSEIKLRNWYKAFKLKKDALIFYERYADDFTNRTPIEVFCKSYPQVKWSVSFTAKSGNNNEFTIFSDYPVNYEQLQEKIRNFCDIPKKEFHYNQTYDYYAKLLEKKILENNLEDSGIIVGENAVILSNGKYLVSEYRGTRHLKFVVQPSLVKFLTFDGNNKLSKEINTIWENSPMFMYGDYKKSEKGTPLFYPCAQSNAKHILIRMETKMKDIFDPRFPIKDCIHYEFNDSYVFIIIENGKKIEYDEWDI